MSSTPIHPLHKWDPFNPVPDQPKPDQPPVVPPNPAVLRQLKLEQKSNHAQAEANFQLSHHSAPEIPASPAAPAPTGSQAVTSPAYLTALGEEPRAGQMVGNFENSFPGGASRVMRTNLCAKLAIGLTLLAPLAGATTFSYVTITTDNNIQTGLLSTFPTGVFTSANALATPFNIPSAPGACGPSANASCNFYSGFGFSGSGQSITLNVSVANATDVYTLMNAYTPPAQQLATITFNGTGGKSLTLDLIGGEDIRDYYQGMFVNALTNGVTGVTTENAFTCVDPTTCLGSGATGNVTTGLTGTYVVDEQDFSLGSTFLGQTLTQIIITDTYNGSDPILLAATVGVTTGSSTPEPTTAWLVAPIGFIFLWLGWLRMPIAPKP